MRLTKITTAAAGEAVCSRGEVWGGVPFHRDVLQLLLLVVAKEMGLGFFSLLAG